MIVQGSYFYCLRKVTKPCVDVGSRQKDGVTFQLFLIPCRSLGKGERSFALLWPVIEGNKRKTVEIKYKDQVDDKESKRVTLKVNGKRSEGRHRVQSAFDRNGRDKGAEP